MEESILTSTKKMLGVGPSDTAFDLDVITHVNSTFGTLRSLGIGTEHVDTFSIEDDQPEWSAFFGDSTHFNQVKSYMYLKVRMLFDPPTTQYHKDAMEKQISELEWRLNELRESTEWQDPTPVIINGGG